MKSEVIVAAWLDQKVVTGYEVRIFLCIQRIAAIKRYPVQIFVSNRIGKLRV